jgi:hypothetical protein
MLEPASPDRDTRIPRTARLDRTARDRPLTRGAATEHHGTGNQQWRRLFEGLETVFPSGHCDWRRPGTRGAERAATKRRRSGLPRPVPGNGKTPQHALQVRRQRRTARGRPRCTDLGYFQRRQPAWMLRGSPGHLPSWYRSAHEIGSQRSSSGEQGQRSRDLSLPWHGHRLHGNVGRERIALARIAEQNFATHRDHGPGNRFFASLWPDPWMYL